MGKVGHTEVTENLIQSVKKYVFSDICNRKLQMKIYIKIVIKNQIFFKIYFFRVSFRVS